MKQNNVIFFNKHTTLLINLLIEVHYPHIGTS
jgi:hypothetical protein